MARGRPRKSDPDEVLDRITKVFWERGYEGASLSELASAAGIAKPGLYAAFGDKEAMFAKALRHYVLDLGADCFKALEQDDRPLRDVLGHHIDAALEMAEPGSCPGGCFLVNTLAESGSLPSELAALGRDLEARRREAFRTRFRIAQQKGELVPDADADALADFFAGQVTAASLMLRAGLDRARVRRAVDVAFKVLSAKVLSAEI